MANPSLISRKLSGIRDRAQLQAHLLSMDAHDIWRSLEHELSALEEQLGRSGDAILAATSDKVAELVGRAEKFLEQQLSGDLSLATPARSTMNAAVLPCLPSDTLNVAAQIMWEEDCGAVPVVDSAGLLLGMLTDRDLAMACYTQGKAPDRLAVALAMSKAVYSVGPDDPLSGVIEAMKRHKVRRIPVITEGGQLLGLVTIADLLRRLSGQRQASGLEPALVDALIAISEKTRPTRTVRSTVTAD